MAFCHKHFDVEMRRKINASALSWPEPGAASGESRLGRNRAYEELRRLPWSEAKRVIAPSSLSDLPYIFSFVSCLSLWPER